MIPFPVLREKLEDTLLLVHGWAMSHFLYVPDERRWDKDFAFNGDHWETDEELLEDLRRSGVVLGDCDAFAKLCWLALRRIDIPSRLLFCRDETGGGHLVCEASGWVLDNRQPVLVPRADLERIGYTWLSMSGFLPGQPWTLVKQD